MSNRYVPVRVRQAINHYDKLRQAGVCHDESMFLLTAEFNLSWKELFSVRLELERGVMQELQDSVTESIRKTIG